MTDIVQMSKDGAKFYPQTHAQAVLGLPDFSTFEKASDVQTAISSAIKGIQQSSLGGGGSVPQLSTTTNLFSGSAVGDILLSGPTPDYSNVQDGFFITLDKYTLGSNPKDENDNHRMDLSSNGVVGVKIPKEKLVVGNSFDISDQLSQYIGKLVKSQSQYMSKWSASTGGGPDCQIVSFGGTTINVLPNTTLSMNLTVSTKRIPAFGREVSFDGLKIPVIRVNTYKN